MYLTENQLYMDDLKRMAEAPLPWDRLRAGLVLIVGATGLIGRNMIDFLMYMNECRGLNCHITAMSRYSWTAMDTFPERYFDSVFFHYVSHDIWKSIVEEAQDGYDYVIHLASNTHPVAYSEKPVDTILSNVLGTRNLLDYCAVYEGSRFVFPSSVEIYGENRGDTELFAEDYMGYLDSNTLRAGYPESKRVCEALCQAYIREKRVYALIPRLPRIFGPTMKKDDSKAMSQFIKKAVSGEDIVLKSPGEQHYSFLYVPDAVIGILTVMLRGENGTAYNIADESCDGTLREAAEICASISGTQVVYKLPEEAERQGYSTATKARLDGTRVKELGWMPHYNLHEGLRRTITILRDTR